MERGGERGDKKQEGKSEKGKRKEEEAEEEEEEEAEAEEEEEVISFGRDSPLMIPPSHMTHAMCQPNSSSTASLASAASSSCTSTSTGASLFDKMKNAASKLKSTIADAVNSVAKCTPEVTL